MWLLLGLPLFPSAARCAAPWLPALFESKEDAMTVRVVRAADVDLWSESIGDTSDPVVLLVAGANATAMMWPDEFVHALARRGLRVIRYDHRDTGRSTKRPFHAAPYTIHDLAGDAVAILDGWDVERAHVVGFSLGGTIGQLLALDWPHRLLTLTVMCTAALDIDFAGNIARAMAGEASVDGLPLPDRSVLEVLTRRAEPGRDRARELDRRVAEWRALAGGSVAFDAAEARRWEERAIDHTGELEVATPHALAQPVPTKRGAELHRVRVRTLVVQAMLDPLNPPPHGRHLAELIPGASLVELEQLGHSLPAALHRTVIDTIIEHISGSGTHPALAAELIEMAGDEELAVNNFTGRALADTAFGTEVRQRLGWHPADDPVQTWRQSGGAPTPPWLADWGPEPHEATHLTKIVRRHTRRLRQIIEAHGWPGRSLVGEDAADAAWLLAMHADGDPDLQQRSIALLAAAARGADADPRHHATLVDRVMSSRDGVQRYGTLALPGQGGPQFLVPVEGAEELDERRRSAGLPPVAEDLAAAPGQLPYRHLRRSPAYLWPPRETPRPRPAVSA